MQSLGFRKGEKIETNDTWEMIGHELHRKKANISNKCDEQIMISSLNAFLFF